MDYSRFNKVKVTVLDKKLYPELQEQYCTDPHEGACDMFEVGQEFIFDVYKYESMNNGNFCMEAWEAIHRYIYAAMNGGAVMKGWMNDDRVMITCCNDGTRPVIFKIERLDELTND